MSLPQISSLSSPSELVRLYHRFFLLPRGDGEGEVEASEDGAVLVLPPGSGAGADASGALDRWNRARTLAVREVDTLLARGQCPFALEATSGLTSAVVLDTTLCGPEDVRAACTSSPLAQDDLGHEFGLGQGHGESATMGVRMAYAMAVTRFVNGVVDEFQTALYASSIANLASKAGLPLWLVQVRHAATHQTCPPLTVLREAAVESLRWLHNTYWLPTYRWAQTLPPSGTLRLPPLHPLGEMQARAGLLQARDQAAHQAQGRGQDQEQTLTPAAPSCLPKGWSASLAFAPAPLGVTFVRD